jgi:hypothetical protein
MRNITHVVGIFLFLSGATSVAQDVIQVATSRDALEKSLTDKISTLGAGFPSRIKQTSAPQVDVNSTPRLAPHRAGRGVGSLDDAQVLSRLKKLLATNE